jgi:Ca2+-binding EF-hand superfamily protein
LVGNQNQETKMDEIFDKLDENENGKISREEFIDILSNNIFLREILSPKI